MIILPAIDILDQQPVRLYQGDYEQKECVGESIEEIAKAFEQQGAEYVHMVDLNGAKEGKKINTYKPSGQKEEDSGKRGRKYGPFCTDTERTRF